MNRHEAIRQTLRAIADGDMTTARQLLQSSFVATIDRGITNDLTFIDRLAKIYDANDFRDEPWLHESGLCRTVRRGRCASRP